jgi:hypothetical protein
MKNTRTFLYGVAFWFLVIGSFSTYLSAMNLTVQLPGGQTVQVTAEDNTSVEQLKVKVFGVTEITPTNQIIFKGDKRLEDTHTLSSYKIKDGDTLRVEFGVVATKSVKSDSGTLWIIIGFIAIIGTGVFFMRRKPSDDSQR